MRGTELLVPAVMGGKLQRADEERLGRLVARASGKPVREDRCRDSGSPDCLGTLKPINRPA